MAKNGFVVAAHAIIEQFLYAKMPPHLNKPINQAYLENAKYAQIVTHREWELELNNLEYLDETQMNTVTRNKEIEGRKENAGKNNSVTRDSNSNNYKIGRKSRTV